MKMEETTAKTESENTKNDLKDANETKDTEKVEMPTKKTTKTKKTTRKKPSSGVKKVKPKLRKPTSRKKKK